MDFDASYIEPLVHDWLDGVQELMREQEDLVKAQDEFYMPFVALSVPVVNAIFNISNYLELGPDAKYIAIHLYDRFMCNHFWNLYKNETVTEQSEAAWTKVCKKVAKRTKLYLMSCLQLASKMDSQSNNLGISQILAVLRYVDGKSEYSPGEIFSTEFKVFQTVGFKMPLCTPLNCVEILLAATGLREMENVHQLAVDLLDLAYLQRGKLYSHLQCLTRGHVARNQQEKKSLMALQSNALFLGASVVLCGTFFLRVDSKTGRVLASKLADLIDMKHSDIWNMANILLTMAIQE